MKLGIFAKTFKSDSVEALFGNIQQHGIACVHYNMVCSGLSELPHHVPRHIINEINQQARKHQLELVGLSATFNMIDPDPMVRLDGLRSLKTISRTAKAIGTDFISLCTGSKGPDKWEWHPDNNTAGAWTDLVQTMQEAIKIAEEYNIILGIEPETGNIVRNAPLARKLLNEMASDRLGIILDPANLFEQVKNPKAINRLILESLDILQDRIKVVHAKDRSINGAIQPAGKGDVDFPFFIEQLQAINFDGPLVLHGLDKEDVGSSVSFLRNLI